MIENMTVPEKPTGDEKTDTTQPSQPTPTAVQATPDPGEKPAVSPQAESTTAESTPPAPEKTVEVKGEAAPAAQSPQVNQPAADKVEPVAAAPEAAKPQADPPKAAEKIEVKPTAPKKVLIVEDTTELAEVMEATLQRMGISTKHETHAAKALEVFKEYQPDLILLDIGLPDMSGWKLLDTIKEINKENRPKIVVITAYGDPANRLMGKLQDVTSYLIKPFSPDEVERVVGKVLEINPETKS
jgi:CheY-like chemotaxis protein